MAMVAATEAASAGVRQSPPVRGSARASSRPQASAWARGFVPVSAWEPASRSRRRLVSTWPVAVGIGVGVAVGCGVGVGGCVGGGGDGDAVGDAPGEPTLTGASESNAALRQIVRVNPRWISHSVVCTRSRGKSARPMSARQRAALGTAGVATAATALKTRGDTVAAVPAGGALATFMHFSKAAVRAFGVGRPIGAALDGAASAAAAADKHDASASDLARRAPMCWPLRREGQASVARRPQPGSQRYFWSVGRRMRIASRAGPSRREITPRCSSTSTKPLAR